MAEPFPSAALSARAPPLPSRCGAFCLLLLVLRPRLTPCFSSVAETCRSTSTVSISTVSHSQPSWSEARPIKAEAETRRARIVELLRTGHRPDRCDQSPIHEVGRALDQVRAGRIPRQVP